MAGILKKVLNKLHKGSKQPFCSAIVAAAGSSSRMSGEDKMFSDLCGVPVIARTLMALERSDYIHEIVIVTREESIVPIADMCAAFNISKATKIVCGGAERIDSVLIGTMEASADAEYLAVHDGARPLVSETVIAGVFDRAYKFHAAAPAIAVNDTIKVAENGSVVSTPDRSTLFAVQTPQVFKTELLKVALKSAKSKNLKVTDDCSAVEALGANVMLSAGSYENIKITTPIDLSLAEAILETRNS